jgi:hypothetical protein
MTTAAPPKLPPPPLRTSSPPKPSVAPTWGRIEGKFQPPRIVLNAVEGFGKTTAGANAPSPLIVMAAGETGYETLVGANLVPSVDAARVASWGDLIALLDAIADSDTGHRTIVLDAMGGIERLCHEHVCKREFGGDWGEKGFASYGKGYDQSLPEWLSMLVRLDRIRDVRGATILMLSHAKVRTHKNPMGADFDRYVADCHEKTTWAATARWADAVLFGTFRTIVEEKRGKAAKGIGGTERVIYTEQRDAFAAKNRYGMPSELEIPDDPSALWPTIWNSVTNGATTNAA